MKIGGWLLSQKCSRNFEDTLEYNSFLSFRIILKFFAVDMPVLYSSYQVLRRWKIAAVIVLIRYCYNIDHNLQLFLSLGRFHIKQNEDKISMGTLTHQVVWTWMSFMDTTTDNKSSFLFLVNVSNKKGFQRIFSPASNNIFSFSQVIYQLRLPGDCKFFTFKCSVNVAIYIYIYIYIYI